MDSKIYFPIAEKLDSTKETIEVEICSKCHPFYSGSEKIIDAAGRVGRFKSRVAKTADKKASKKNEAKKTA
jgi:large subunit ribosomal protein L31